MEQFIHYGFWEDLQLRKEVLYKILIKYISRLIRMCLMKPKVWIGKNMSNVFPIHNGLKQGDASSPLL
jgi:hypothetical protein